MCESWIELFSIVQKEFRTKEFKLNDIFNKIGKGP